MKNSRNLRALLKSSSLALALTFGAVTGVEAANPWERITMNTVATDLVAINGSNTILGLFYDDDGITHGFVRAADGSVTTFDAPTAQTATIPMAMNADGTVVGYLDNGQHGFVRGPKGDIHVFDVPGSVNATVATAINVKGIVAGWFSDGPATTRGFVRTQDGTFTTFAPPDAISVSPVAVNGHGVIAGAFRDSQNREHAFVRDRLGRITVFDVPGALNTNVAGMNAAGEIVGSYDSHGFLRETDGTLTAVEPSGSDFKDVQSSFITSINFRGIITGCYLDATFTSHGWVRNPSGTYFRLDAPGARNTCANMIGPNGKIIGSIDYVVGFRLNRRGWDNAN